MRGQTDPQANATTSKRRTYAVRDELFREVYDSPRALPGKEAWVTPENDVRELEKLLGIPSGAIGAPLWVSGDRRDCPSCGREISWLDIVSSALGRVHDRGLITRVILGAQRFVNTEVPAGIAGVTCFACGAAIDGIRSFKCHNWAYAHGDIARLVSEATVDLKG